MESIESAPPEGVAALYFCVVDERGRLCHQFRASNPDSAEGGPFRFLESPTDLAGHPILADAFESRRPVSMALAYGQGQLKYIYVLPYERRRGKWRFACMQVTTAPIDPDAAEVPCVSALAEERVCLMLVDAQDRILSVSSRLPEAFGHTPDDLMDKTLQDVFRNPDIDVLKACSADTNESILGCSVLCLDGGQREVEVKKFSAPDHVTLYGICDITPRQRMEEFAEVTARERRRIGQDLHDSIGQVVTGISLLSRSLSNVLSRDDHARSGDASQISELADAASNQIRQISRGLMPSEIVQRGFYESLQELARITTGSCGIACETRLDETLDFSDVAVATHLYRIAQEAVNNSVRHAQASRVEIVVSEIHGMSQLEVLDNGQWIEPKADTSGIGLKTMQYRATAIGGQLYVGAAPQGGTQVTCRLEIDESLATKA